MHYKNIMGIITHYNGHYNAYLYKKPNIGNAMDQFSRQILYKNIGGQGQKILQNSEIAIVGIGSLGSVCSELLARSGIGNLFLIDRDYIEESNLLTQTLYTHKEIGQLKTGVAAQKLSIINPKSNIKTVCADLNYKNIEILGKPDIILGCTDNLESRFLINDYALKNNIPWIHGAAVADRGMIFSIIPGKVCLRCIMKEKSDESCDTVGIINTVSGIVAASMVTSAIKSLLGRTEKSALIHINAWNNEISHIKVSKSEKCPACRGIYEYLEGKKHTDTLKLCGKDTYQIKGKDIDLAALNNKLSQIDTTQHYKGVLHFKNITVFEDNRVMIHARSESEAKKIYTQFIGY
jgi:molybdopterin/thiamine biosynthesis adenylyltransferase